MRGSCTCAVGSLASVDASWSLVSTRWQQWFWCRLLAEPANDYGVTYKDGATLTPLGTAPQKLQCTQDRVNRRTDAVLLRLPTNLAALRRRAQRAQPNLILSGE